MIKRIQQYAGSEENHLLLLNLSPLEDLLFFDIETTGFHRAKDQVISITLAHYSEKHWHIIQWFTESPTDEKAMLLEANEFFLDKPVHLTYNGHSFDIPFLLSKYEHYTIFTSLNKIKCYDLYRIARNSLQLDSYKLKNIERALGIFREDLISGKECTELYKSYLLKKDLAIPEKILLHNYEDVLNLIELAKILNYTPETYLENQRVVYFKINESTFYLEHFSQETNFIKLIFTELLNTNSINIHAQKSLFSSQQHYFSSGEHLLVSTDKNAHAQIHVQLATIVQQIDGHKLCFIARIDGGITETLHLTIEERLILVNDSPSWGRITALILPLLSAYT